VTARAGDDLVGPPRLRPGEGFALRRGIWRWALDVATERADRPAALRVRGDGAGLAGRSFATAAGVMHARAGGPPAAGGTGVVLVHGVLVSSRYLMPLGVELAREVPVLIPDLPGYGLSERPTEPPTLASLADALIACARAAGHERVALVANSFGAQVAVEAAMRHPDRVERIALLGPTVDPAARDLVRQYLRWQRCTPDEHLSVLPIMARDVLDVGPARAARLLRIMLTDALEAKLPHVGCPALVVRGGRDRVATAAWTHRVAALLPHGELVVIPGYAHMAHYSGPLVVAQVLRPFLADSSRRQ
jgi:pimeloyl-ACP methyl ester carboxylesterase